MTKQKAYELAEKELTKGFTIGGVLSDTEYTIAELLIEFEKQPLTGKELEVNIK